MYVDARDNYSETELKNRASVCKQRRAGQARPRATAVCYRALFMNDSVHVMLNLSLQYLLQTFQAY